MIDLLVIGGGPGGYVAAIRARQLGMTVVLVEQEALGGTCLNRGCIPTKAYYKNAEILRTMTRLEEFNVHSFGVQFNMSGAKQRKDQIVNKLVSGVESLLQVNGVEIISAQARIQDASTVIAGEREIKCRRILIASGSQSADLIIAGIDLPGVLKSEELLEIDQIPERLLIIGGGVIGLEFACIFNSFGSKVTVCEYAPSILSSLDSELSKRMNIYLKRQGIEIHTATQVQGIEAMNGKLLVTSQGKKGSLQTEANLVLAAAGRRAATQGLALEQLGIDTDKGFIQVDKNFETSVKGIFAIGDVIGETDGFVKVIADQDDTIIGVHIMGPHASDLILEATLMVKNRMKIDAVKGTIHPHPTLGESLQEAIADLKGESIHLLPKK